MHILKEICTTIFNKKIIVDCDRLSGVSCRALQDTRKDSRASGERYRIGVQYDKDYIWRCQKPKAKSQKPKKRILLIKT